MSQDDKHLLEKQLTSTQVFDGHLMKVYQDTVALPDGGQALREYTKHPWAVMIIPVLDDSRLVMERQFRYPLNRVFLEFPAGKCEKGEPPEYTARRELIEETGYRAKSFSYLTTIHPVISYSTEEILLYTAHGLSAGDRQLDDHEFLDIVLVSLPELLDNIRHGLVTDVKTIIGAFWLEKIRSTAW
jgi:ADP-ribose pyrophosphatase